MPDAPGLARAAAEMLREEIEGVLATRDRVAVALSGGATPRLFFRLLGAEYRDNIKWRAVHLFWADERAVPPDHEQSNFRSVSEELLSKITLPPGNVHRIPGELAPEQAAAAYEADLQRYFGGAGLPEFDLIFLGVGEDGHTASLFPGAAALAEKERLAVAVDHTTTASWRVTLTLPVLNNASRVVFLVAGRSKTQIVRAILTAEGEDKHPAGLIKPRRGTVVWLLDQEAAAGLPGASKIPLSES